MAARMLVLLSNLHLTDGSCGDHSASDRLSGALNELQYVLKKSRNGLSEKIDVVLLGDTFDFTSSRKWQEHDIRPWDDSQQVKVASTVKEVFEDVVARYSHGFTILNRLLEDGIEVGSPQKNLRRIPLQMHYMVGDTDRMLHHFGPAYDAIRERVCELMQLSNRHDIPFPHEPIENETILSLFGEYGVFARHGDLQDPWSCEGDRRASSVNELMQIELVQPFIQYVLQSCSDDISDDSREHLIGMINAHHVSEIHAKLVAFSTETHGNLSVANRVLESWHDRLDKFLRHKRLQNRVAWQPLDLVAELRKRLTIEHHSSINGAVEPRSWFDRRIENENHTAWIPQPITSRADQRKTEYFVTAHYSQDVVIELIDRPARADLLSARRAA